jgi:hypothetical protein
MISQIYFRRMLYLVIGLVISVAAILAILVIPPSKIPERAIIPIWVNVLVHLLIVVGLVWIINVHSRKGKVKTDLLAGSGFVLVLLSLLVLDGAFAYINDPNMIAAGISLFICVGCDFFAGLLAPLARFLPKRSALPK